MTPIHHVVTGQGDPPIVFVHGFACGHADWDAQVAHFAPRHRCIAVDLRGHGSTGGAAAACSIERYGADVAALIQDCALQGAILAGHSMGCRVVIEAALQAPGQVAALVLVDGSQFAPAMAPVLRDRCATEAGYRALTETLFADMFTARSDPATADRVLKRAAQLPVAIGARMLNDLLRYDVWRLEASLASLRIPILALQSTYSNEKRERQSMQSSQTSPYLDMVRARQPTATVAIVPECGHFPQLDQPDQTNREIDDFIRAMPG